MVVLPVDDGADEDVAEDADHEDDGLEERPHDGVVEGVVLGVPAPSVQSGHRGVRSNDKQSINN